MVAVVGALVVQVAWMIVRAALGVGGAYAVTSLSMSFGVVFATSLVIAAGSWQLGAQLTGSRRVGARLAAGAYLAMALAVVVTIVTYQVDHDASGPQWWRGMMETFGFLVLDLIAISGFSLAAGRRGRWLGPIAFGFALLAGRRTVLGNVLSTQATLACAVACVVVLVVLVREASRGTPVRETSRERAVGALRVCEIVAWIGALLSILWAVPSLLTSSMYIALAAAVVSVAIDVIVIAAAWRLATANVPGLPSWLWYADVTFLAWSVGRTALLWTFAVVAWGRLDASSVHVAPWSASLPGVLASACALAALATLAVRQRSRELALTASVVAVLVAVAFALRVTAPDSGAAIAACYAVSGIAMARALRVARLLVDTTLPRARIVIAPEA